MMKFQLSKECKDLIRDKWGKDFTVAEGICKDLLRQQSMNALRLGCTIGVFVGMFTDKDPDALIVAIEDLVF